MQTPEVCVLGTVLGDCQLETGVWTKMMGALQRQQVLTQKGADVQPGWREIGHADRKDSNRCCA